MVVNNKMLAGSVILLIDNQKESAEILSDILVKEGCTVIYHTDGIKALDIVKERSPDLVFCRINVPEQDGYTLCRTITADVAIPVILFDERALEIDRDKGYKAGCVDYIILPFVPKEVTTKTEIYISHYKRIKNPQQAQPISTEKERAERLFKEEMFLRTQRLSAMGELLSALAHEIRQPLHGMRLILEGIIYWESRKEQIDDKVKMNLEYLGKVITGIDRIDSVIDNVYKSMKQADNKKIESLNFNEIIKVVLDIFHHKIKYHGIELTLDLDPGLGTIQCTQLQAEQVVINLLSNAIKALDKVNKKMKVITIVTEERGDYVLFKLSDNGPGISGEIKEKIFDPFFTTEKEIESLGMGLYVVHTILDSFNSTIEVSRQKNGGTTFSIKFMRE